MIRIAVTIAAAWMTFSAMQALAQTGASYPEKPVRIVVPWGAGGNADVLTRVMAQKLMEAWGHQIVVDNRAGANGMIGSEIVVRSKPDGYTLLVDGVQTHALNPYVFSKMTYNTQHDLAPVTLLGGVLHILVANSSLPVRNTNDLVALAKARPQEIPYASWGPGSLGHLAGELLQQISGIKLLHVPYSSGSAAAVSALLSGEVALFWPGIAVALPHIKSGRLKALGIASKTRSDDLPELPTLAEQLKAPEYDVTTSFAVMVPVATPQSIISKLHAGITRALASPSMHTQFGSIGATLMPPLSPAETLSLMKSESDRWGKVVRAANIGKS
jgi:tripartite-type tricarboxylate transporter receptor subunit TctC